MPANEAAACMVKNGWAALGCEIAYVTPMKYELDGLWLRTSGGKIKISRLKRITIHSGYELPTYYTLSLDDGAHVDSLDAVRIGP